MERPTAETRRRRDFVFSASLRLCGDLSPGTRSSAPPREPPALPAAGVGWDEERAPPRPGATRRRRNVVGLVPRPTLHSMRQLASLIHHPHKVDGALVAQDRPNGSPGERLARWADGRTS